MRHTGAGLTRRVSLALVAALIGALVFTVAVAARPAEPMAPNVPNLPHCFMGLVTAEQGAPLGGRTIVARAVSGYWKGQLTTVSDSQGRYGYSPSFCISGYDSSTRAGAQPGDQIAFFVDGRQVVLYNVATGGTSSTIAFEYGGNSRLNLVVPLQETITATAGDNGSIDPAGDVSVPFGGNQTFTFTPAAGYQIDQVFVDEQPNAAAAAAGSYTFTNVREPHTIRVTFIKSTYTITVNAGEGCTITPAGNQVVNLYGEIQFTVAPLTGYTLVDVKVDETSKGPLTEVTLLDVTADHTVSATCARQSFTVTPSWGAGGKIVPGTAQTVLYGEDVTFEIQPDLGYVVEDVVVNGESQGPILTYTFQDVTAAGTIAATFKKTEAPIFKILLPAIMR